MYKREGHDETLEEELAEIAETYAKLDRLSRITVLGLTRDLLRLGMKERER